ncbi:hypothetical protein RvY_14777 [Ramazzottius varieornatus]|uniref:Uncharacterized protein n=1 Tax=Ramazzottius varieornatus TaxID=947166 RepID=A0A1D1VXG9_RAMVA|nr:hypothetical protein RvY_14777 [Ramazzottius varieornatus]
MKKKTSIQLCIRDSQSSNPDNCWCSTVVYVFTMTFIRIFRSLAVFGVLLPNCVDPVHVNLVPCPGRGNSPFEINCIVPDLIDSSPAAPITVSNSTECRLNLSKLILSLFKH